MQKIGQGKEDEEDHLSMLKRAQEEDSKKIPCIFRNLTPNQMEQKFPWILTNLIPNQMEQISGYKKLGGRSYLLLLDNQCKN